MPSTYDFTFETGGYAWDVVVTCKHYRIRVTSGWTEFAEGNGIQVGSMLKFEYVRVRRHHFMVTVTRWGRIRWIICAFEAANIGVCGSVYEAAKLSYVYVCVLALNVCLFVVY